MFFIPPLLTGRCPPLGVQVSKFPLSFMFGLCVVFLFVCVGCQMCLVKLTKHTHIDSLHAIDQEVEDSIPMLAEPMKPMTVPTMVHHLGSVPDSRKPEPGATWR